MSESQRYKEHPAISLEKSVTSLCYYKHILCQMTANSRDKEAD